MKWGGVYSKLVIVSTRAIIAEDESILRLFLSVTLSGFGLDVAFEARNGAEAINAVRELKPDVAFLDINMDSKEDGLDAGVAIKSENPDTKVFFLSAYPKKVFTERLDSMDYDGYLEKPVNKDHLRAFLFTNKVIQSA